MEKAESARLKNRTDDAISHYNQAISIDPEFVAARNNLAVAYLKDRKCRTRNQTTRNLPSKRSQMRPFVYQSCVRICTDSTV